MNPRPPRLTRWLFGALLPNDAEVVRGDVDEEFVRFIAPGRSLARARWWYRRQAAGSLYRIWMGEFDARISGGGWMMGGVAQDVRLALRNLVRAPGFTVMVLMTLGLGIGATTAIFSAANEVVFRPLEFADPDRLVMVWERNRERGWDQVHAAPANVLDWRERVEAFADVAMADEYVSSVAMTTPDGAVQVDISKVSGNLFDVLGVTPALGRPFRWEETWLEGDIESTIILSHSAWQRHFGGDPDVLGTAINVDGLPRTVVGIMGDDFRFRISGAEMWIPYLYAAERRNSIWFRQAHVVRAVARLADGWSHEQARGQLEAVAADLRQEHPDLNRGMEAGFSDLHHFLVGERRTPMFLLLGAVGLLLLIASANVANLFLVRGIGRSQETAVRGALGAGRGRLAQQILTEGFVTAALGGVIGAGLGALFLRWIGSLAPAGLSLTGFHLDGRMVLTTIGIIGVSAVLFGFAPALRGSRVDLSSALAGGGRNRSLTGRSLRASHWIVAGEVALALMLAGGAGLMFRSLNKLASVDLGVESAGVLTFEVRAASGAYPTGRDRVEMVHRFLERLRAIPGVTAAGVSRSLPLQGFQWSSDFTIEGWAPDRFGVEVRHREATPGYFDAMRVPVLEGRLFDERWPGDRPVPVVVNQAFVDRYFADQTPVGGKVTFSRSPDESSYWYDIVGVVGNERLQAASPPLPEIIAHVAGDPPRLMRFAVRSEVPPLSLADDVREAMRATDPAIPVVELRSMDEVAHDALAAERFLLALFSAFAFVALGLAAVGVYGISAEVTRSQLRDIGIKVALGAPAGRVLSDLIRRGGLYVSAGILVGLIGAAVGGHAMEGVLYQVEPTDPRTLVSVGLVLGVVAITAVYLPARAVARGEPARVLRQD